MRVVVVVPHIAGPGGSSRYALDLQRALRGRGVSCDLLSVRGRSLRTLWSVWRGVRGYDLVHAIDPVPVGIYAFLAAKARRLPFVISAQGTYAIAPLYNWKTAWLSSLCYRWADGVIAISRFTRSELLRKVPAIDVTIITHGVWGRDFDAPPRTRQAQGPRIISVGRVKRRKGYHIALESIALLRRTYPHIQYLIVGLFDSPGYAQSLLERAAQADLAGAVEFKERVSQDELKEAYRQSDIFLLPSINEGHHFEGFGLVFLEAAAARVPAVGTLGNGIEDAIIDGQTGVLVPQNDPEATAKAIERVWTDWDRMSAAAYSRAAQRDWSAVAEEYALLYRAILAR